MKKAIETLIASLYSGNISKDEFLQKYFDNKRPDGKHVSDLLKSGIINKDASSVEEAIVLLYTEGFSNPLYISELCQLLQMPWHTKHEDIAMLLKDIADPSTVECLYDAAELQFEYLDYDETYQFGRKCIKALSAIGDEASIDKLKMLSKSKIVEIAEYAKKELNYKGLL